MRTSLQVMMTGKEDIESPWKIAVAGFPGAGKTLLASTAEDPIFVFFSETPRIKSVADRHLPHVKITNTVNADGKLVLSVQDQLLAFLLTLEGKYKTLVLDTGNEFFQLMKEARRLQNRGEFGPGDWSWLADAYREIIGAVIDAPLTVIILFHVKNVQDGGDDGQLVRELMLQGSSKDEAPAWFDVVGVVESREVVTDKGDTETRRSFLTSPNRLYPWLKDHSGNMPRFFDLSPRFVDDVPRMLTVLQGDHEVSSREMLDEIDTTVYAEVDSGTPVPTPEDLEAAKQARAEKQAINVQQKLQPVEAPKAEVTAEEGEKNVTEILDGTEVLTCEECGTEVGDFADISKMRTGKVLCREHFITATKEK